MGGYENGKKAADLVAGTVFNYLRNCNQVNSTSIDEAIKKANLSIKGLIDQYDTKSGATLGCLILGQEKSFLFWVGDVSLYLFKDDNQIFKSNLWKKTKAQKAQLKKVLTVAVLSRELHWRQLEQ